MSDTFTTTQASIVELVAAGHTEAEAAGVLGVEPHVVKFQVHRLRKMLGVARTREIPQAYWRATGRNPFPKEARDG